MSAKDAGLIMLYPEELPISHDLDSSTRETFHYALHMVQIALENSSSAFSLEIIEQAIMLLNPQIEDVCEVISIVPTLKTWEIQDYDTFFGISRVRSPDLIECVILSLLLACQNFLYMTQHNSLADSNAVNRQIIGFKSHIDLIVRVLDIPLEGINGYC
jgi:hypothetical protein